MKYLLDTHVLLWLLREPSKLPLHILQAISSTDTDTVVSHATVWEIAIKVSLNKLQLPAPLEKIFPDTIEESGISFLPIHTKHILASTKLPWHHRDPFDRLLVAQAQVDQRILISSDRVMSQYDVQVLW